MLVIVENTDDYEIIGTGSVISFEKRPIRLKVVNDEKDPDPLFIEVIFKNDAKKEKHEARPVVKDNLLQLTLVNYNNSLGTGTKKPQRIGRVGESLLYINYRVYAFNDESEKLFYYTLYKVKKPKKDIDNA